LWFYAAWPSSRVEYTKRKKENVFNQKSSRRTSTERRKTKKNIFCAKKHKKVFLSLSSLCVIYPGGRSFRIKTKKVFFVFLLSVETLLEADPNEFRTFSFFSLGNLSWGKVSPHKHTKRFILVFLLSVEALLEADPKEFSFGAFYVFFLLFFLSFCGSPVLLETDPYEFDLGNFPNYSFFFFFLCKIPAGESQST
jgi:hypothetical protein